ncbi:MAG: tripartite tricarboxylate transporter substrate binding protein [Betaproteobacteria bacterium]|nr:tripartite tricarboxylate transporter substrate binding protein [Betaproteobacteria bacterium]MBI3054752.1 tripartite tricarboxylate transporter substrate binding protein [Betaproteobacteria bacterium]
MKKLLIAAAAVLLLGAPVTMLAQDYPNQPVRLIVGFAAGGSGDIVARIVAQLLAPLLGQPVVVENKPGAGGMIGADFVAKAPPDGHTLLLLPSGHATGAAIRKKLPFEPVQDFAWITTITTYPFIIATRPESQLKSLADLIARAKAQPGSISYSSVGVGSAGHLLGEWFSAEGRIQLLHVPFRGGTTPLIEVQTGRVDLMFDTITLTLPHIKTGRLHALAVTSRQPVDFIPNVPVAAQTVPGYVFQSWLGIAAPAATPAAVVERLNRELHRVLREPDMQKRLSDLGGVAAPITPNTMRAQVASEIEHWRRLVESRGIEKQ